MKFCCSTARSTGGGISAGRLTLGWVLTLWKCLIDICNVPRLSGESFLDDLLKIEIVHLKSTFLEEKWFRFFLFRREGLTALRRRLPSNGRDNFIEELKSFAKGNEAYGGDVEVFQQRFSALTLRKVSRGNRGESRRFVELFAKERWRSWGEDKDSIAY